MILSKCCKGKKISSFLIIFISLLILAYFWFSDFDKLLIFMVDDAAYYFNIAKNMVNGLGSTFDGINQTNGYHPLWLVLLLPFYEIFAGQSPEFQVRIVLSLQVLLLGISSIGLFTLLHAVYDLKTLLVGIVLFVYWVLIRSLNGLESALMVSMIILIFFLGWLLYKKSSRKYLFLYGIGLGFLMLSRLDMVFVAFSLAAIHIINIQLSNNSHSLQRDVITSSFFLILFSSIPVIPYLILNKTLFGHVTPISGMLKSSFPIIEKNINPLYKLGISNTGLVVLMVIFIIYVVYILLNRIERSSFHKYYYCYGIALCFGIMLHAIYTILFTKWAIFGWHFIPYKFVSVLIIIEFVWLFLSKDKMVKFIYPIMISFIIVTGAFYLYKNLTRPGFGKTAYDAAVWLRDHTNQDDVIAMKDSGYMGYFSERRVINLDGVVNNLQYQRLLSEKKINQYFSDNGVQYFIQHAFWNNERVNDGSYDSYQFSIMSMKYNAWSDPIYLNKENEVYRSQYYYDGPYKTVLIIWKYE